MNSFVHNLYCLEKHTVINNQYNDMIVYIGHCTISNNDMIVYIGHCTISTRYNDMIEYTGHTVQ